MNKKIVFCLLVITILGLFFHFYKINQVPRCLNADEAAFGYNAYSILKTGKDEYGNFLPLRLKSFADNKMPLLTYLTIPFVALFGLNDWSIKLLNALILALFPTVLYFFTYYLFKNKKVALLTSFMFVLSWGVQSMGRQLHEALLTSFLVTCAALFFLLAKDEKGIKFKFLFILFNFLSLFSYQSSRIFASFFILVSFFYILRKKISWRFFLIFISTLILFSLTDIIYRPQRVSNLLFFNNSGFSLKIHELRTEGGSRLMYNKLIIGLKDIIFEYSKYFSPQFLAINGDDNYRFGYVGLSPITIVEYLFFFIGLYYLFKNIENQRFYLIGLLLISPLSASLSWANNSLTRSFFIFIPVLILSSYGFINFIRSFKNITRIIILVAISVAYLFFIFYNWDFYLNHYPIRNATIRAWQCGYKDLVNYIKNNYNKYDNFYISKENGQPYIFLLFYLKYPPQEYQRQANLSGLDKYGFGQVERFEKFIFNVDSIKYKNKISIIGYPHDIEDTKDIKKIKIDNEEIFYIKEIN